jgi:hypothetical protein
MATSGTTTFESGFYIDDIITEAYERLGRFDYSGNDIKTARRSLNIMFQEWGNRGLHFWEVKNNSITLVDGQAELKPETCLTIIMSAGFRMPGPMVIMQTFHIDSYLVWYLDLHIIYHKNLNQN